MVPSLVMLPIRRLASMIASTGGESGDLFVGNLNVVGIAGVVADCAAIIGASIADTVSVGLE